MIGDGTSETRTNAIFKAEDPLLPELKQRLGQDPNKRRQVGSLFKRSLTSQQDQIVAVRSDDILTTIKFLMDGEIPTNPPDETAAIRYKAESGHFYLTPIGTSPYFQAHPELLGGNPAASFNETVRRNTDIYASNSAFLTAFNRNVASAFKPNWQELARPLLKDYFPNDYKEIGIGEINEFFANELEKEIKKGKRGGVMNMVNKHPRGLFLLNHLSSLLVNGVYTKEVIKFLSDVDEERGGVVIGFNSNVLQGKVIGELDDSGVVHDSNEIVIQTSNGKIDLLSNPIVAIETLGEYEDRVLEELGLI